MFQTVLNKFEKKECKKTHTPISVDFRFKFKNYADVNMLEWHKFRELEKWLLIEQSLSVTLQGPRSSQTSNAAQLYFCSSRGKTTGSFGLATQRSKKIITIIISIETSKLDTTTLTDTIINTNIGAMSSNFIPELNFVFIFRLVSSVFLCVKV